MPDEKPLTNKNNNTKKVTNSTQVKSNQKWPKTDTPFFIHRSAHSAGP